MRGMLTLHHRSNNVHGVHVEEPATLYCPAAHACAVADVEPAAHMYPAVHWPEHVDVVIAVAAP